MDIETREGYWNSDPKNRGGDRLCGAGPVDIDDDAREVYWSMFREVAGHPSKELAFVKHYTNPSVPPMTR
jgi:hypothetical protein